MEQDKGDQQKKKVSFGQWWDEERRAWVGYRYVKALCAPAGLVARRRDGTSCRQDIGR